MKQFNKLISLYCWKLCESSDKQTTTPNSILFELWGSVQFYSASLWYTAFFSSFSFSILLLCILFALTKCYIRKIVYVLRFYFIVCVRWWYIQYWALHLPFGIFFSSSLISLAEKGCWYPTLVGVLITTQWGRSMRLLNLNFS